MHDGAKTRRTRAGYSVPKLWLVLALIGLLVGVLAGILLRSGTQEPAPAERVGVMPAVHLHLPRLGGMVRIPAGRFAMGPPDDGAGDLPPRITRVRAFWLDETPVTNGQFALFVDATGYTTTAESRGKAAVYDTDARQWRTVDGADWRHPSGPWSSIAGLEDWPVVQVSWYDAVAYARWAGKRLPTEAEYEYAARAGLADCRYPWGRELVVDGRHQANAWQGRFPDFDLGRDGRVGTSAVRAFPESRYGLFDMLGNVYAWCADPYAVTEGAPDDGRRVQRGGSWLSAVNHEPLAVWRRRGADPRESTNHIGFRCASDTPPEPAVEPNGEIARRPTGPIE